MDHPDKLSPFVYWAQDKNEISLRIELQKIKDPEILIESDSLKFCSIGIGAKGENCYGFDLKFYDEIDSEKSTYRITDRQLDFHLKKLSNAYWPRLLLAAQKPAWLKVDFDKWKLEEFDDEDIRNVMDDYINPDVYEKLLAQELVNNNWRNLRELSKKIYMTLYNMWQFVAFFTVILILGKRYTVNGEASLSTGYAAVSWLLRLCLSTQFLEVLHPTLKFSKGSWLEPLMQCTGRGFIYFVILGYEPRLQTKPVAFYLFFVWSLIEIFRYPYYLARIVKKEIGVLTWLRYTMWIPLYPLGFILEGVVILRAIPYFEETGRFSVNIFDWFGGVNFYFPHFLWAYLIVFILPAFFKLMTHMKSQRDKKLSVIKKKKN